MKNIIEVSVTVFITVSLLTILAVIGCYTEQRASTLQCKVNLSTIGRSFSLYNQDFGKSRYYPDTNGGGFVARLYQVKLITNPDTFNCSSSSDSIPRERELQNLLAEDLDSKNIISYAGRKNIVHEKYPGLFKLFSGISSTTLASDDWQGIGEAPHNNGSEVYFVYLEGHASSLKIPNFINSSPDYKYSQFASKAAPAHGAADPLTN